jgi:hypothetical protein
MANNFRKYYLPGKDMCVKAIHQFQGAITFKLNWYNDELPLHPTAYSTGLVIFSDI